ncbi:hypothetical protein EXS61_00565 [Candidatus Parcubacteria bacterium]|nr:hypothetical protein [Candidatus Parcubacteria bacterium]
MKTSPKDFFLHLGVIISLYISTVSLLTLVFNIINNAFPDNLNFYVDPYSAVIRWAIACLIIIFPLYIFLSRTTNRDYVLSPEKRNLGIRKWLTYFTLFLAGVTIIIDLIVLINTVLGGEIASRFIFKVVAVLVVVGLIFIYYIHDLKSVAVIQKSRRTLLASITGLMVLASIVSGFMIMGSPVTQRLMRFDAQKLADLQTIQWQLVNYFQQKGALPETLTDLRDPISGFVIPVDSQNGLSYEYKKISEMGFELCADFNVNSNSNNSSGMNYAKPIGVGSENENWSHAVGQTCFKRTIDAELYPPTPKRN